MNHKKEVPVKEERIYLPAKTKKEKILEQLAQKGYHADDSGGVPVFSVEDQAAVDTITEALRGVTSFGFRYPAALKLEGC